MENHEEEPSEESLSAPDIGLSLLRSKFNDYATVYAALPKKCV